MLLLLSLSSTLHIFLPVLPPSPTLSHTHTHICPSIPSITQDEETAEPSSGSKGRGGRQGRGVGRPAGCPRAALASKKSKPSSDKDAGHCGRGRTRTSPGAMANSSTGGKGEEHADTSEDSGRSLILHSHSLVYIYTLTRTHTHTCTHTHICPPIPSITQDEETAKPSSGSKGRGGRQGRGVGRPAGCPRAALASKKSKPSSDKDAGHCGRGRTRTSAGAMAISPTGGKGEEHADTSEDSGGSLILHSHCLVYIYTLTRTHTPTFAHQYPLSLKTRRLLNLHLAARAVEAVKVAELVDQQVVPGPPLQVRRTNLLPTRTLVVVAEVEHGRQLVPWQILPPEGREKSMLIPLRTVVGHSFYTHTPSYTYTHLHAHTHTHICPPIPSITQDEETAKPSSGSKGRGGRQGRGVGRPAGCPRAALASKKSKPSSDKDAGHCGRGRTRTSAGAMAISPTGGKGEEHADTSEDSGGSLILHSHCLVYIYTLTRTHTPTFAHQYPLSLKTRRLLNLHLAARAVEAVKVAELVDQQVVPGPPLQVRRTNLLPTRTLVVVAEVEHGRQLVPWQILPPEGREKSMLIPLRTVVGHSFYTHTPSYTYTHLHAHTHTHICPPIPSITQDEETAKPSSGSKGRGGRQGRGVGRPAGCPRAALASKKSKPSSDKDAGHCGRGRTRTSAGAMAISPTGGKGEEHADTSEDSGGSLILHSHCLVYIYTLTRTHTHTFARQYPLSLKTRRLLNLHLAARAVEAVKVAELVDQQVVPGPPLQVRRTSLLPTRTLVVVAEVEHGRHLVPWQILPPEGREKSMLIPLRTVVGHSFYIHTPSYTYTHLHAHTHTHAHTHIFAHQYPLSLKTRRLLNLHLAARAVVAVKVAELVDQQVAPGPPLQVRRASLLPTRMLVIVAEVEHGRQLVPWQFLPPEGREKSMLIPLRTVVGHSFYIRTASYTYTHLHAHTHTHLPANTLYHSRRGDC